MRNNTSAIRQSLSECIKMQDSATCCLQEKTFKHEDNLQVKTCKKDTLSKQQTSEF